MSLATTRDGRVFESRAHRTPAVDATFGPPFRPEAALPAPEPLVSNLALAVVEILAGLRDPEQVQRWVDVSTVRRLHALRLRASRRAMPAAAPLHRASFAVVSSRVTSARPGVIEASAVVTDRRRARAVALRMEAIDDRWHVTELHVL